MTVETFPTQPSDLHTAHTRRKWGWIVALGVLFIIGGVVALFNVFAATVVAIIYVAAAMVVAGGWEIVTAFQIRPWGRALLWGFVGAITLFAGVAAARFPVLAAMSLTALLGALLIAGGVMKLVLAYQLRDLSRWELIAFAGGLSVLLGVLILVEWPVSGLYVLGLFLGVNLLFEGVSWVAMGLAAKPAARLAF
ncbi:HdeD family acid-resistance protein [Methylocystis parvus]|uniref:HdeD family acid-resistance protein n=1 Tax=Methylocystis parvus TaxID=134 RepID=A0A6B8M7H4_9HYPH|nr:HdeD family acid-resistance protein [Methylocystis parvus]QGM98325.1 HdeD family acid-resistance protein [Methylocystis parvus]WBK01347.1 HdeD family acid-resistance protein [Methylocystis parvus OBBP]